MHKINLSPCLVAVLALSVMAGVAQAQPKAPGTAFKDCEDCPEMVVVPAGTFAMGTPASQLDNAEVPAETGMTVIRIARPFALGKFEVTRREYARFVEESGYEVKPGCRTWDESLVRFSDDPRRTWRDPGRPSELRDDHPVSCVNWADARAYAQWLAKKTGRPYRLPSEAEWEYGARAGTTTLRFWGDSPDDGCEYANTYDVSSREAYPLGWTNAACRDGYPDVAPVGQFKPNAFGLYDMIGNVWEWAEDCSTASYVGRPKDGSAWTWLGGCKRRIQRGGGWITGPERSRPGFHGDGDDADRADFAGFRIALDLDARGEER